MSILETSMKRPLSAPIGIMDEHPEWSARLIAELNRRGLPWEKISQDPRLKLSLSGMREPDKLQATYESAIALHQGLGVPFSAAMQQAKALQESPNPQTKRIPEAAADEWKAAMLYFSGSTNLRYRFYGDNVVATANKYQTDIESLAAGS